MFSFGTPKNLVETNRCVIYAGNSFKVWHDSPWMPSGLRILFAVSGAIWKVVQKHFMTRTSTLWEHTLQRKYSKVFKAENSGMGARWFMNSTLLGRVGLDSETSVHKNQHQGCQGSFQVSNHPETNQQILGSQKMGSIFWHLEYEGWISSISKDIVFACHARWQWRWQQRKMCDSGRNLKCWDRWQKDRHWCETKNHSHSTQTTAHASLENEHVEFHSCWRDCWIMILERNITWLADSGWCAGTVSSLGSTNWVKQIDIEHQILWFFSEAKKRYTTGFRVRLVFACFFFGCQVNSIPSLKLTWHLKMDGWNTSFLLGWPIFRCYLSFRECI